MTKVVTYHKDLPRVVDECRTLCEKWTGQVTSVSDADLLTFELEKHLNHFRSQNILDSYEVPLVIVPADTSYPVHVEICVYFPNTGNDENFVIQISKTNAYAYILMLNCSGDNVLVDDLDDDGDEDTLGSSNSVGTTDDAWDRAFGGI